MTVKRRGLGKGLDALLGTNSFLQERNEENEKLRHLPVELIQRGQFQPRKTMNPEALQELSDSIRAQGIMQPILVRKIRDSDRYEIIAGERRWRAAQMAGLHNVPVLIRDVPDQTVACIALIENIQREDLNPLEEAQTLSRLIIEFKMTHEAIAEAVGRSRAMVSNLLRLLELHPEVQALVQSGSLEMGHARAIVALPIEQQLIISKQVVKRGLSVRATEQLVRDAGKTKEKKQTVQKKIDPNIRKLQDDLCDRLGARVIIKHNAGGKGSLVIQYNSVDELDGILGKIK